MERILKAVYRDGVLTPLEPLDLPEDQQVTITLHMPVQEDPDTALEAWQQVYAGLSEDEVSEVEQVALNRTDFMRQED